MYRESKVKKFEEARAILVLGLLAVLASIRSQTINFMVGDNAIPLNQTIDITILLMSMYTICTLIAFSQDIVGAGVARMCRGLGITLLSLSLTVLAIEAAILGIAYYQMRFLGLLVVIGVAAVILAYYKLRDRRRNKVNRNNIPIISTVNIIGFIASSTVFLISIMGISYYLPVEYMWLLLIPTSVSMVLLFFFTERIEKEKNDQINSRAVV